MLSSSPLFQTLQEIRNVLQEEKGGSGESVSFVGPGLVDCEVCFTQSSVVLS